MAIKITGIGSYIPDLVERNEDFHQHQFLNTDGSKIDYPNETIVEKFKAITGIVERRYAKDHLTSSDLGFFAAEKAIDASRHGAGLRATVRDDCFSRGGR